MARHAACWESNICTKPVSQGFHSKDIIGSLITVNTAFRLSTMRAFQIHSIFLGLSQRVNLADAGLTATKIFAKIINSNDTSEILDKSLFQERIQNM